MINVNGVCTYGLTSVSFRELHVLPSIFTTIFNTVIDAVLRHWVTMVTETKETADPGAAGTEGLGRGMKQ